MVPSRRSRKFVTAIAVFTCMVTPAGASSSYHRVLKKGERQRGGAGIKALVRTMQKMHGCEEAIEGSNEFSCSVGGTTIVRTYMNSVGLWRFMGDDTVFIANKASSGSGSLRLSSSSPTDISTSKATLKLPGRMPATSLTTISYDYYSNTVDDDSTPLTVRVGISVPKKKKSKKRDLKMLSKVRSSKEKKNSKMCYFDYAPTVVDNNTTTMDDWVTFTLEDFATTVKQDTSTNSSYCPSTIAETMASPLSSSMKGPKLASLALILSNTNTATTNTGYLDNVKLTFAAKKKDNEDTAVRYAFDLEPAANTIAGRSFPVNRFTSFKEGWLIRNPSKTRKISFSTEEASTGTGSLKVGPLDGTIADDHVVASYNMKRRLGSLNTTDLSTVAYDYLVKTSDAGDGAHFYLSLFASLPADVTTTSDNSRMKKKKKKRKEKGFPKPDSFDCRFDYAPSEGVLGSWSTMEVSASTTASVSFGTEDTLCPSAFEDMPIGSSFGLLSITIGNATIPENVDGVSGYLDNVILTTENGGYETFDFEVRCRMKDSNCNIMSS